MHFLQGKGKRVIEGQDGFYKFYNKNTTSIVIVISLFFFFFLQVRFMRIYIFKLFNYVF